MWFQREKATQFLTELLDDDVDKKVLALLCTGIAKLVLNGMITDQNVSPIRTVAYDPGSLVLYQAVRKLVEMYVSPKTASNQELRQALTFALPVYSYSSPQNQLTIVRVRTGLSCSNFLLNFPVRYLSPSCSRPPKYERSSTKIRRWLVHHNCL